MNKTSIICFLSCLSLWACNNMEEPKKPVAYPTDSILLEKSEIVIQEGTSIKINICYNTTDNVSWESRNPELATVSETGIVTSHNKGTATIVARCYEFNGAADSIQIDIIPINESEYVPDVLLDWGTTSQDLHSFINDKYSESNIKTVNSTFVCSKSNSISYYRTIAGADDAMLVEAFVYVWGKPDSILKILDAKYTRMQKNDITTVYTDDDTSTRIECNYIRADQGWINKEMRPDSLNTDFFVITYKPSTREYLSGVLTISPLACEDSKSENTNICIIFDDGEKWYIKDTIENRNFPFIFRNTLFSDNDNVIAMGVLSNSRNQCNDIVNHIELMGLIHK